MEHLEAEIPELEQEKAAIEEKLYVRRPAVRRAYGAFGADHGTHGPDRHQKHAMAGIERDRRLIPSLHTL